MFFSNLHSTSSDSVWQWKKWNSLPYLSCELLSDWQHGFFTQQWYPRQPKELSSALSDRAKTFRVKQVHGNTVLTPQETSDLVENSETQFPDADGIITDDLDQSVWVASADCNPVLIGDRKTGRVAAVHAGWRGTARQIVPNAVFRFKDYGSELKDLAIAIGPAITGEVYQVGENVAVEVGQTILKNEKKESSPPKQAILDKLLAIENSPVLEDKHPGRVKLDVRRVNQIQLQQIGIDNEQIAIAPYCTYQQPDYFFSYRRTKQKKVQWSGIISN